MTTAARKGVTIASAESRDLEKVIEAIRLGNIEKEIRSSTARLDVRKVHPVDEVQNPRAVEREAAKTKKVFSRRANANNEGDIRIAGALARAKLEEKGVSILDAHDAFEHEERIWTNKAHSSSYLVKRRFDNPELHNFAKTLDAQSRKEFEHLSKENLYRMSQSMRESVSETKKGMDRLGIFHPEVNAHRASSQYLIKLYRGITTDNVEDMALKKLQADLKKRAALEEGTQVVDTDIRENSSDGMGRPGDSSSRQPSSRVHRTRTNNQAASRKHETVPNAPKGSRPGTAQQKKIPEHAAAIPAVAITEGLSSAVATGGLFKSKYKAAGTSDPRAILEEEAARLQSSRVVADKQSSIENKPAITTLEDRATETLFRPLKANLVANAGGVKMTTTNIRNPVSSLSHEKANKDTKDCEKSKDIAKNQVWKEIVELNESLPKLNANKIIAPEEYAYIFSKPGSVPQHIMTFDDFQAIFSNYNSSTNKATEELKRLEREGVHKVDEAAEEHQTKSRAGIHRSNSAQTMLSLDSSHQPSSKKSLHSGEVRQPVDTIGTLNATDKKFKAFRDLQLKEKEFQLQQAIRDRKLSVGMKMSERANRRTSRLGVKAVVNVMSGTRGESKGFINVFGDPAFKKEQEMADRSEVLRLGGISGLYDADGRKLMKRQPSMEPRPMTKSSSRLPYYSSMEINKLKELKGDDSVETTLDDENSSDEEDSFGSFDEPRGVTDGNYPPLGPLIDTTKLPSKRNDGMSDRVQSTLVKVWDILNTPTIRRVEFMAKYSTQSYFASLQEAVNLWAQCATYCTARLALITVCRNIQKNENIPVSTTSFLSVIDEVFNATVSIPLLPIPKAQSSNSTAEVYLQRRRSTFQRMVQPNDIRLSLKTVFTSALFMEHFNMTSSIIDMAAAMEAAESADAESQTLEAARDKATAFFKNVQRHIDQNLISLTTEAYVDLDDVIPFGTSSCRDWVAQTKYPALTKKNKKKKVVMTDPGTTTELSSSVLTELNTGEGGKDYDFGESPDNTRPNTPGVTELGEAILGRASTPSLLLI